MINIDILYRIDIFRVNLQTLTEQLKEIYNRQRIQHEDADEIYSQMESVKNSFRLCSRDFKLTVFDGLPVINLLKEPSETIEKIWLQVLTATEFERRGIYAKALSTALDKAIKRLSAISNDLGKFVKEEMSDFVKTEPAKPIENRLQPESKDSGALIDIPHPKIPELEMLNWFNDEYPKVCRVKDYKEHDIKTDKKYAAYLKKEGLIEPDDRKMGFIISSKGRDYIESNFS